MTDTSNGVRLDETTVSGYWQAHTAAGGLVLTAVVALLALRRTFRNNLGG